MMTWRQWFVLLGIFTLYLLLGGAVFMAFEAPLEDERRQQLKHLKTQVFEVLLRSNETSAEHMAVRMQVWDKVADFFGQPYLKESGKDVPRRWNFFNSFFVAFTVTSTIGYGHLAPSSSSGRLFCIAFALIGIPLNGILLATLGDYFGVKLVRRSRSRAKRAKHCGSRLVILVDVCLYLIPGLVAFLALPAALFACLEGWSYLDAFYYAFVSLTTIGFGDLVAGHIPGKWLWMYHIFLVIWIMFGLGYLVMVINIIAKGLTSEPLVSLERKMAARLRNTRARLAREGVVLRKLVNELAVLQVRPVYRTEVNEVRRTGSQPFLSEDDGYKNKTDPQNADAVHPMPRHLSDTVLKEIDRSATFKEFDSLSRRPSQRAVHAVNLNQSPTDPLELLAHLADVLCEEAAENDDFSHQEGQATDASTDDTDDETTSSVLHVDHGLVEAKFDDRLSTARCSVDILNNDEADGALIHRAGCGRMLSVNMDRHERLPERERKTSVAELYRLLKEMKLSRQNSDAC